MENESLFAEPRFWVALAFVVFFVLFGRKMWSAIASMLDTRAERIRAELDEAKKLRREAEAMLVDARRRREDALKEAEALLASAHTEAQRLAEQARADAEAMARRHEQMAMDRIASAEKAAVTEVRVAAAEIAARAAEQIIAQSLSPEQDAAIIDRAISGLPAALASRRAA
jgi:F-type H+-transporting ATPase subunit b